MVINMKLILFAEQIGLQPKRVASTHGGEYHSACPDCGGNDRFIIQPLRQMKSCKGYYFCRQCGIHGDTIQFCREYLHISNFQEAVDYAEGNLPNQPDYLLSRENKSEALFLAKLSKPNNIWSEQAKKVVEEAHKNIWHESDILQWLQKRGLSSDVVRESRIGWLNEDRDYNGNEWGPDRKKVWVPGGLVIPFIEQEKIVRIKVRRKNWQKSDKCSKYAIVSGSMQGLNIVGNTNHKIMIVLESELDAYALHDVTNDFAFVLAIGGALKCPDQVTDALAKKKTILICNDNDSAGENMLKKWLELYHHANPCSTPFGKDIGEAFERGLDLRSWIINKLVGIDSWSFEMKDLIIWFLEYVGARTKTRRAYYNIERDITDGPAGQKAVSGELERHLRKTKSLVEVEMQKNKAQE